MKAVDDAVLAKLRLILPPVADVERVHEGKAPVKASDAPGEEIVLVESPVPFGIYVSDAGRHVNRRHTGRATVVPTGFDVTVAALSHGDVKTVTDRIIDELADQAVTVVGHQSWRIRLDDSDRILPDPRARLTDGRRLLRSVLRFTLATTR